MDSFGQETETPVKQSAIHACDEEEYSLAPSWFWRHSAGWRPLLIYFRGPASVPFFIAPFHSLLGIWRFARRPPRLTESQAVVGATVTRVCEYLGSYGMGGPGFVGLRLSSPAVWLVITVWGAADWITVDGIPCREGKFADEITGLETSFHGSLPRLADFVGSQIVSCEIQPRSIQLVLSHAGVSHRLQLLADSPHLPVFRGSKEPRNMPDSDDLRTAVILSRRAHLWLT